MTEKKKLASEWHLEGNWDVTEGKMHGWISLSPIGPPLFELIPLTGTEDEIEASARLIAAAPEMDEVLGDVLPLLDEVAEKTGLSFSEAEWLAADVRRVRAKARGEQS